MVKKTFAKLALGIMIGLMMTPVALADASANVLINLANPFSDIKNQPCIQELKQNAEGKTVEGPDSGYVISIMEEPLNVDESGSVANGDAYVVRRCFRNTFQYTETQTDKDGKELHIPHTVPMLSTRCSQNAQTLMESEQAADAEAANRSGSGFSVKYSCKEVQAILTKGGTSGFYGYINMIYRWGASLVGLIAVTIIIVSGIQISASGGDSEAIGSAKKRIIQSIVGIVVLFLASLILYTLNPTFFTK